nr:protein FAR1-RELATED SEQUENCE 5-like [Lolium perenne]
MTDSENQFDESMAIQGNFSFMALLNGELDMNYSSSATHIQGEAHLQAERTSGTSTHQHGQKNTEHEEPEDIPWETSFFNDMQLDEVVHEDDQGEGDKQDFDHTWYLDRSNDNNGEADSARKRNSDRSDEKGQGEDKYITEEDIEIFLENDESATDQNNEHPTQNTSPTLAEELKPEKGMEFKSREDAHRFLNTYSYAAGFSIAVASVYRTTSKKRNNEITRATIKCSKHGHNTEAEHEQVVAQRQTTVFVRTDCKVEMVINEKNGIWKITNLKLEHNHPLEPGSRFFRSHVYMKKEEKSIIRTMKQCNIPTRLIVSVLAHMRGGMEQLPYNKRKACNYASTVIRELKHSDLMEVLAWFNKKQAEEPGFYYSLDLDGENKVKSIFWSDARARQYYQLYGDCICFDTTFLTNKYNLPFAAFVGISPHGKTYLFACGFIINEQANSFEWLFRQFLTTMGGIPP